MPCKVAAQIDLQHLLNEQKILKKSELKTMSTANIYATLAGNEAIVDSAWSPTTALSLRAGTSIGTGMAGVLEIAEVAQNLSQDPLKGHKSFSPYFIPKILPNLSSGLLSIRFKLKGPNTCVTTACAAGSHAIADAYGLVKEGRADMMLCGATEACVHPVAIAGFSRMRALATKYINTDSH